MTARLLFDLLPLVRPGAACALLLASFSLAACQPSRTYSVQGRVVGFGDDDRTVFVAHDPVPGLMPAMTMPFSAIDTAEVASLDQGDAIRFTLVWKGTETWIEGIEQISPDLLSDEAGGTPLPTLHSPVAALTEGDQVPDLSLVTQDGEPLSLSSLHDEVLVVNFIYTRCPIPDYCPLLSRRFAELQRAVEARYDDGVHLLSISFDPEHDTPGVLAEYAARYDADPDTWTFATGTPDEIARATALFGVLARPDGEMIDHGLTTALILPAGHVRAIWRNNDWTPDAILRLIDKHLATRPPTIP